MNIVIDVIFVLFILLIFFLGYSKGFLKKAWWLVDVGLIVVFGIFLTPTIKNALSTNLIPALENAFTSLAASAGDYMNIDPVALADICATVIIWLALAIVIIIVMAIVKCVFRKINQMKVFKIIDKILGGVYSAAFCFAILMVVGALLGTCVNFQPIADAAALCNQTYLFKYVFGANLFQAAADQYVPLGSWIGGLLAGTGA